MGPSSFGLEPKDKAYILEEVFLLMEHCHFSYEAAWALPVEYRKWFVARKDKENKQQAEEERRANRRGPKPTPPRKPPPARKR